MGFCECDISDPFLSPNRSNIVNGLLCCVDCAKPIECEFSYLDMGPHPAETIHVDYWVCNKHLEIAVDNVSSRWA